MNTIIYLVFAAIIILITWVMYQRQTFKGFVTGAVLCTFITASGASYDKVLPVEGKWVMPPKGKWLKKKDSKQKWGRYVLPTDTYTTSYPLGGWPDFMKVEVRRAFYYEDCPTPIVPEIETITEEDGKPVKKYLKAHGVMQNITPKVLATLCNPEIAAKLLDPSGNTVQDNLNPQKKSNNKMMILLILVAIGVVVSLVGAFLTYMVYSGLNGHISYWGG